MIITRHPTFLLQQLSQERKSYSYCSVLCMNEWVGKSYKNVKLIFYASSHEVFIFDIQYYIHLEVGTFFSLILCWEIISMKKIYLWEIPATLAFPAEHHFPLFSIFHMALVTLSWTTRSQPHCKSNMIQEGRDSTCISVTSSKGVRVDRWIFFYMKMIVTFLRHSLHKFFQHSFDPLAPIYFFTIFCSANEIWL